MGVDIGDILEKKQVGLDDLAHRTVAIDGYNTLYQFLSIIRQRDGTPLKDSKGNVTSHLSGILYRMTNLFEAGIKPVFVFDGKPPDFKADTISQRKKSREEARTKWDEAKEKGLSEDAYKYAQASSKVDARIVEDSMQLLDFMGIPSVQAPSEGEAQAAYMVNKGDADYSASQDYDSLLFGAPRVVRNLTITGKRKLPGKNVYIDVEPESIDLMQNIKLLDIDRRQLIGIALCVGTDYNKGLEKIGPKTALKLIKQHGSIHKVLKERGEVIDELDAKIDFFLNPPVTDAYELKWKSPQKEKIVDFLCKQHDFSEQRVLKAVDRLEKAGKQQTLDQWF